MTAGPVVPASHPAGTPSPPSPDPGRDPRPDLAPSVPGGSGAVPTTERPTPPDGAGAPDHPEAAPAPDAPEDDPSAAPAPGPSPAGRSSAVDRAASRLARAWSTLAAAAVRAVGWTAERWRRSLQLRVAATTVLLSGIVVLVVGILSVGAITAGVLDAKRDAAHSEVLSGVRVAQRQLAASPQDTVSVARASNAVQRSVLSRGTAAGLFSIVVLTRDDDPYVVGAAAAEDVPEELRQEVGQGRFADMYATIRTSEGRTTKGLVVGAPVTRAPAAVELYYLFPLDSEQRTVGVVRNTVLLTGILLVLLLAAVALLVTRQVVRPVRTAAVVAQRFASGRLQERMQVRGEDDLAALAAAFNDMADSLQGQITKLEEMSRLQRRFTSDVSHELRTPLTTIRMATDLLHAERGEFAPHVARSAELLQAELDRFESLLADLLEISRYDAHVAVLEPDPIDLRGLVRSSVDAVAVVAEQARVELLIDLPDGPVVADVDGRRVERILRNLLVNAVDHAESRPVEVKLRGDGRAVAVTVRDHGVGLRPGEAALVFDRFWRADLSRDRRTGGTGLGLAISLEDARLHGGWLHAWGRPGQGAQFRLTLPVRNGDTVVSSPLPIEPPDLIRPTALRIPAWPT